MKKNIAIIIALILMMSAVLYGCGKKDEEPQDEGQQTSQHTQAAGDNVNDPPQSGAPDSADQETTGGSENTSTSVSTPDASQPASQPSSESSSQPSGNSGNQTAKQTRTEMYKQILATGNYTISVVMVEDGVEDMPTRMSVKNGNVSVSMEMEGMQIRMLYTAENDTTYVLLDFMSMYCDVTEDMLGDDFDFSKLSEEFDLKVSGVCTESKATFEGKEVICETYDKDGKIVKYYYDSDDTLLASEEFNSDGSTTVTRFELFSASADDADFVIPSDYKYIPLSLLMNMA